MPCHGKICRLIILIEFVVIFFFLFDFWFCVIFVIRFGSNHFCIDTK